jgi:LPXTG-motif cell wall-anchored protein
VVLLLSTGSETVQVEIEVDMASFEIVSSPVPELSLPATGSSSAGSAVPVAAVALIAGLLAVLTSRRRRLV